MVELTNDMVEVSPVMKWEGSSNKQNKRVLEAMTLYQAPSPSLYKTIHLILINFNFSTCSTSPKEKQNNHLINIPNMATALLFLLLLLAAPAAHAVQYTVGDSNGWTQGVNYGNWVSGKTFNVGDVLDFSYSSLHAVDVVSQSDYTNCVTSNALQSYSGGSNQISLTSPGPMYFICPTPGHCSGGMKLAVTVSASNSTANPPSGSGTFSPPPPPPPPHSGAAIIFCNTYNVMAILISLLLVVLMG